MTRDDLLKQYGSQAPTVHAVEVEGYGTFHVRRVSVGESLRFASASPANGASSVEAWRVLQLCLCDESGQRLLGDTPEDEAAARNLPSMPFLHVVNAAMEFIGMGKKGRVAELAKNS